MIAAPSVLAVLTGLIGFSGFVLSCSPSVNFSQYAGFHEYFAAFPRHPAAATPQEQRLLETYRPRLFIGAEQEGPISFYEDYIAHGTLSDRQGHVIARDPSPAILNMHTHDPHAVFVHTPDGSPATPVAFARIDRADVPGSGVHTFLTYHFVFRSSGIPAGTSRWIRNAMRMVADSRDWHQLDHYTMARVVLDRSGTPVAVVLQQHNYVRSYVAGRDITVPHDKRIVLDAALDSNELYPHLPGRHHRRAVPFMTAGTIAYLVTGDDAPWIVTDDITDPADEVDYALAFLPHTDAFYSFQGYLGERRRLPGRSGPPGADYNALPRFKPLSVELVAFNWREDDHEHLQHLTTFLEHPTLRHVLFPTMTARFRIAVACQQRKERTDCRGHAAGRDA